jgi:hypothetical protein
MAISAGTIEAELILKMDKLDSELNKLSDKIGKSVEAGGKKGQKGFLQSLIPKGTIGMAGISGHGGLMGGVAAPGAAGMALGGAAIVVEILKSINNNMIATRKHLAEASPIFRGVEDTIKRIGNNILAPIGVFISMQAKPYMMLMMAQMKNTMKRAKEIMQGGGTEEEKQADLQQLYAASFLNLSAYNNAMNNAIGPMIGFMGATQSMLGLTDGLVQGVNNVMNALIGFNNYLKERGNMDTWALAFEMMTENMTAVASGLSGENRQSVLDAAKKSAENLYGMASALWAVKPKIDDAADAFGITYNDLNRFLNPELEETTTNLSNINPLLEAFAKFTKWVCDGLRDFAFTIKGIIDYIGSTVSNIVSSFMGGGKTVGDAIITPSGVVHTAPDDYIIATKNPGALGGGNNITININGATVTKREDIDALTNEISRRLFSELNRNSYMR